MSVVLWITTQGQHPPYRGWHLRRARPWSRSRSPAQISHLLPHPFLLESRTRTPIRVRSPTRMMERYDCNCCDRIPGASAPQEGREEPPGACHVRGCGRCFQRSVTRARLRVYHTCGAVATMQKGYRSDGTDDPSPGDDATNEPTILRPEEVAFLHAEGQIRPDRPRRRDARTAQGVRREGGGGVADAHRAAGRGLRLPRAERRGQEHDDEDADGPRLPDERARCRCSAARSATWRCKRRVGFLPEQFRFHEWMQAAEFLDFHGQLYGMGAAERRRRIPEVLGTRRPGGRGAQPPEDLLEGDAPAHRPRAGGDEQPGARLPRRADRARSTRSGGARCAT